MYKFVYIQGGMIVRVAQYPTIDFTFSRASDLELVAASTLQGEYVCELSIE